MTLTYWPITGKGYLPDGVTSEAGQWRIRLAQGYALDGSDWRVDEQRFDVAADGSCPALAAPGLPATTGTQVYSATFVSASGRVVMGPYTFTLTAAKTFADILSEPGVVVPTTDLVAEAQAARDEAQTAAGDAAASAAAAQAVGDTNDTIMAGVVGNPASATSGVLNGAFVARAPAPSGSAAGDQANLQPLFDAAIAAGGGTVHLTPSPVGAPYQGDYTLGDGTNTVIPSIRGGGAKINGTLTFRGATAAFTGAQVEDLQMVGTRPAGVAVWTFQGCVSVKWRRIRFFATADTGILFHNKLAGDFTEMCSGVADFGPNIKTKVEYRVTAGKSSFHGCGLDEGTTLNQGAAQVTPEILIGPGAEPYNCPLSATFWVLTAQPLILHQGMATSAFYGHMKIELLPNNAKAVIVDPASVAPLSYAGTLHRRGKFVDPGRLVLGEEAVTSTFAVETRRAGADDSLRMAGSVLHVGRLGTAEWVQPSRKNRALNPRAGNGATYVSGYNGAAIGTAADTTLGGTNVWTATTTNTTSTQGLIYLQPAGDLAQGQVKTIAFDVLSPVDITMYAGGYFGLSGSPGTVEVGQAGVTGDVEYIAANVVHRVRRVVTVPPPNSGGTITYEGMYIRANTASDMPAVGTVFKVSNVVIEDGVTSGSAFSGGDTNGEWLGLADQAASVAYPTLPGGLRGSYRNTGASGTVTLPAKSAGHWITMTANTLFAIEAPVGRFHEFTLKLEGAFNPTWPATVKWPNSQTQPTYTSKAVYRFVTFDGGANWHGSMLGSGYQ